MSVNLERLLSPSLMDILLPFFAFFFVIVMPSVFAFFVMYKAVFTNYGPKK